MKKLIVFGLLMMLFAGPIHAEDYLRDPREEGVYKYLSMITHLEKFTDPIKRQMKKHNIDLDFFAGVLGGFDNNVDLDSDRKKDALTEVSLNTEATYNYTDDLRIRLENYTTNVMYFNINEANLIDMYNEFAMETDLLDDLLKFGAEYALEFVVFPNDEDGSFHSNHVRPYIRHNITPYLYHEFDYKFLYKWYEHDKTIHADGYRTSNRRRDERHAIDYVAGVYIGDKAMLKTKIELYHNNGNYEYRKYYDYWLFKIKPSVTVKVTDRLYASSSFAYQQRRYDGRLSSEDDEHVFDDTFVYNASLLYDLTKSFTAVVNFSYRENASNEPLQRYSGSLVTAGLYYSF
jgi:hypothetical protein